MQCQCGSVRPSRVFIRRDEISNFRDTCPSVAKVRRDVFGAYPPVGDSPTPHVGIPRQQQIEHVTFVAHRSVLSPITV
jgi:hypothetical protein